MVNKQALIIFVKDPVPGQVKTRLAKDTGNEFASQLYAAFLQDIFNKIHELKEEIEIYVFFSGSDKVLRDILPEMQNWIEQSGKDLGEKMKNAFETILQNSKKAVIIGSDMPHLELTYIKKAFKVLDYVDLAIGKSEDGGYYLLALKKVFPELFENIIWSTETVYKDTVEVAEKLNLDIFDLPESFDVDDIESLQKLKQIKSFNILKYTNEIIKNSSL